VSVENLYQRVKSILPTHKLVWGDEDVEFVLAGPWNPHAIPAGS